MRKERVTWFEYVKGNRSTYAICELPNDILKKKR